MRITATDQALVVLKEMATRRSGTLTITIGTGCCESTAPFLYEDFWPGPDQAAIGELEGVEVYAPEYLRDLYPGDEAVILDVVHEMVESLSVETELGVRLALRGERSDSTGEPEACDLPRPVDRSSEPVVLPPVVGEMPEALRRMRMR